MVQKSANRFVLGLGQNAPEHVRLNGGSMACQLTHKELMAWVQETTGSHAQ